MTRFALVGAAGFVAPRHLEAIRAVGGKLVAALDPHDAVGVLDRYDRDTEFFTEEHRFERFLERQRQNGSGIDWLVVCSPNYLHDRHIRMGLWSGARVLCEKPLVVNPDNLDRIQLLEREFDAPRVFGVLQLRHAPQLQKLRGELQSAAEMIVDRHQVKLHYVTPRGRWYHRSWKGDRERSGGVLTNIGIHMFDLLIWLFGSGNPGEVRAGMLGAQGSLQLERADVEWYLSVDPADAPDGKAERWMEIDGVRTNFDGFEGLHTQVYRDTLAGHGFGIDDARPALELVAQMRSGG